MKDKHDRPTVDAFDGKILDNCTLRSLQYATSTAVARGRKVLVGTFQLESGETYNVFVTAETVK